MSKTASTKRARRPKKIYAKGWETRRRRAEAAKEAKELILSMGATLEKAAESTQTQGWQPVKPAQAGEVSAGDAIMRTIIMHRDEQLCCFLAEVSTIRRQGVPAYAPLMVSRSQVEAIESLLEEAGYSQFGKRGTTTAQSYGVAKAA